MAERALATAFVNLVPGTKDIDTYLKTKLGDDAGTAGDDAGKKMGTSMGGSFTSTFKNIAGAVGLGLSVAGVVNFFKDSAASLATEQAGQKQTAATIASTGNAAKVTAGQVESLAQTLESKTATDADAIRSGENMLLTFTNIRNEAGKGNDVFNQATSTLVDFSRAMGTDPKDAAIQLGKALNDPVAGITALSRVGVQFTPQQKAVNKALVEGGDANALMAMGLIDSSKAFNDQVKEAEKHGKTINDVVNSYRNDMSPAQQELYDHYTEGGHAIEAQKVILGELNKEFGGSGAAYASSYSGQMAALKDSLDDMGKAIMEVVLPALKPLADGLTTAFGFIKDNLGPVSAFIGVLGGFAIAMWAISFATNAEAIAQLALNLAFLANPMTWVALAVAALVAGIVWLATKTTFFQDTWKIMSDFVNAAIKAVGKFFEDTWNGTLSFFKTIGSSLKGAWDAVSKWFSDSFTNIGKWFSGIWEGAKTAWNTFSGFIMGAADKVKTKFEQVFQGIQNFIGDIFQGLVGLIRGPLNSVIGFLNRIIDKINGFSFTVPDWVPGIGGQTIGFNLPHIPALAAGGFVTGPTTALIGEAGPEVVTPLKDFERMIGIDGKSGQTINYYAAPNDSIDAERKLIDAVQRARVLGWT